MVCELALPDDATIAAALSGARRELGDGAADWEHAATGIYGNVCARDHIWADGDRIELYRSLQIEPRAQRRVRAAQAARAARIKPGPAGRTPRRG
jgi:putative ubiquitin-RnfH superfamily antitoxin RatB of RatAB toxin-antitoxin module